jgi:hypothetical protein
MNKKMAMGLAVIGVVAVFLPWITAMGKTLSGLDCDYGWVTVILFGLIFYTCLEKDGDSATKLLFGVGFPAGGIALYCLWTFFSIRQELASVANENLLIKMVSATVSIDYGLYLTIGASLAIIIIFILKGSFKDAESKKL